MRLTPIRRKKGVFDKLIAIGVGIAGFTIAIVVTLLIIAQGADQAADVEGLDYSNVTFCEQSGVCNSTNQLADATQDLVSWVPLVVIAMIGVVLLGLVALFAVAGAKRRR